MTRQIGRTPDLPDDRPTFPLEHLLQLSGGRRAEWEAIGDGPPLLWIEGGPGLPAHLARPEARLLADRFRCYLVNAPGCGRSTPPSSPDGYGLDDHVRYFDEVRRALGHGPVTLMGHSFGGLVALALTLAFPEAVERLIIISGYAGEASVPEDVAAAERDVALDRLRDQPRFAKPSRRSTRTSISRLGSSTNGSRPVGRSISPIRTVPRRRSTSLACDAKPVGTSTRIEPGPRSRPLICCRRWGGSAAQRSSSPASTTSSAVRPGTGPSPPRSQVRGMRRSVAWGISPNTKRHRNSGAWFLTG